MGGMGPVQPTEPYYNKGQWGWDGSQWRKLALLWGYSDRLVDESTHTKVGAGGYNLFSTTVPAGEIWSVQLFAASNIGTAVSQQMFAYDGSVSVPLQNSAAYVSSIWNVVSHPGLTVKAGDRIYATFAACQDGDELILRLWGSKQKVV